MHGVVADIVKGEFEQVYHYEEQSVVPDDVVLVTERVLQDVDRQI